MFNVNGPPRGANVSSDQYSYDLIYKNVIFNSNLATINNNIYSFTLDTDNINKIYSTELVNATIAFDSAIPNNIINQCVILNIPQLNGTTTTMASNVIAGNNSQGNLPNQGNIFCQVPDNNTPLIIGTNPSNNIISMFIQNRNFEAMTFYNPPISNINKLSISFHDPLGNIVPSSSITSFYLTIRFNYFQKRNSTTAFSVPVVNFMSGITDSAFVPFNQS
jgi:hypothetical protein